MVLIAVHLGAGSYSNRENDAALVRLLNSAVDAGLHCFSNGGNAETAACAVVAELEKSPLVNAGFGSNLTKTGIVECDAGVARVRPGQDKVASFGAVGAAPGLESPVAVALEVLREAEEGLRLIPSMSAMRLVAGKEAWVWAKERNLPAAPNETDFAEFYVTPRARGSWTSARDKLETFHRDSKRPRCDDTVGCICVADDESMAVAVSSGGPVMRSNGRVGPAAVFGMGFYASDRVAVCATGSSDFISRHLLSRSAADGPQIIIPERNTYDDVGIMRISRTGVDDELSLQWAFTSPGLALAYSWNDIRVSKVMRQDRSESSTTDRVNQGSVSFRYGR